jgi:uncharacterized protein with GYD domain
MVTAIVLINVARNAVNETAQALVELDGVTEVYSVAGEWDLVAVVRSKSNEQMADIVTEHMLKFDGIQKTTTLFAFRAYSRHDLEAMFSIGMEEARSARPQSPTRKAGGPDVPPETAGETPPTSGPPAGGARRPWAHPIVRG